MLNATRVLFVLLLVASGAPLRADDFNWPQWRGPHLDGTTEATGVPTTWSETENVLWKTPLPWWCGSSPVVWNDHVFVTSPTKSPTEEKLTVQSPGGDNLLLICIDRKDGKVLWQHDLGAGNELKRKQNMASPSPVTDGKHVWIMTGVGNLFCLDFEGKEIWKRSITEEYGKFGLNWGYASSPALLEDRLIIPVLHGYLTDDPSYLLAVEKDTGNTIWKVDRPTQAKQESPDAYGTPGILKVGDKMEIVMNGGDIVTGSDPKTGLELWRVTGGNPGDSPWYRVVSSVVCIDGLVFAPSRRSPLTCIKGGGKGDITESHVLWRYKMGPDVPTPVSDGKHLWIIDDDGRFTCLDAQKGEPYYKPERLAQGTYDASLVLADGKIFATNEGATTTVMAATPEFKVIATNKLDDEYTLSTPAIAGSQIFLRTSTHLYCIGTK